MSRQPASTDLPRTATVLLYHFCRLQLPQVVRTPGDLERHLVRTFELYRGKNHDDVSWAAYLEGLYPLDWFVACSCLDGDRQAWEYLFAARTTGPTACWSMPCGRGRCGSIRATRSTRTAR